MKLLAPFQSSNDVGPAEAGGQTSKFTKPDISTVKVNFPSAAVLAQRVAMITGETPMSQCLGGMQHPAGLLR
jgi:hypothetical protein